MRPVPEYDAKAWLLKALRETSHAMETLLWEVDERALHERSSADDWTCGDVALHMCEMERRYVARLKRMVQLEDPHIDAFDGESIEPSEEYDHMDVFELMDEFGVLRRQSVYLLWSLDEIDWERRGIHPYLGPLTITQVAREMNEHDLAHLWQVRRICDRAEAATV